MAPTIFVSSTFADLEHHRKLARDAITRLDVNSKAMEFFGALPDTPKEECLRLVRASNVFVTIVGMRYGYIDPATDKSMTQLEYEEAQTVHLPTLVYLLDEDRHPVLPKHVETGVGAEKLQAFKAALKKRHVVNTFASTEDLAAKVTQDLVRLMGAMNRRPPAQVLPQLAANATRMLDLTQPRFEFLKSKVAGVYKQDLPDSILRETLGFILAGDNMAATFVISRGTPMPMDDAIDGLMAIEKILIEVLGPHLKRAEPEG